MTTPNKITLVRIAMIPVFVTMALYYGRSGLPWHRWAAVAIFVAASASDGLDGYIARRYNQRSRLGQILDPIADKGLLLAGIITLSISDWGYAFPLWFPVLVIARDAIVVGGAVILNFMNGTVLIRPSWTGKTATALQMIALALVMFQFGPLRAPLYPATSLLLLDLPVYLAALFTAISGFGYVYDGMAQLHDRGHGKVIGKGE